MSAFENSNGKIIFFQYLILFQLCFLNLVFAVKSKQELDHYFSKQIRDIYEERIQFDTDKVHKKNANLIEKVFDCDKIILGAAESYQKFQKNSDVENMDNTLEILKYIYTPVSEIRKQYNEKLNEGVMERIERNISETSEYKKEIFKADREDMSKKIDTFKLTQNKNDNNSKKINKQTNDNIIKLYNNVLMLWGISMNNIYSLRKQINADTMKNTHLREKVFECDKIILGAAKSYENFRKNKNTEYMGYAVDVLDRMYILIPLIIRLSKHNSNAGIPKIMEDIKTALEYRSDILKKDRDDMSKLIDTFKTDRDRNVIELYKDVTIDGKKIIIDKSEYEAVKKPIKKGGSILENFNVKKITSDMHDNESLKTLAKKASSIRGSIKKRLKPGK